MLGPELLKNGTFDSEDNWTLTGGFTISDGMLNWSASSQADNGYARQLISALVEGKKYRVGFAVSESSLQDDDIDFDVYLGGTGPNECLSNGDYTFDLIAGSNGRLEFIGYIVSDPSTPPYTINLDNVSVREILNAGLMEALESWFAEQLAALTCDDKAVFKTAEIWRHQIAATKGGMEAFVRYEPFAFVGYSGADAAREGGYQLRQVIEFSFLIGVESKVAGAARTGDATHLGTSKIRDLVIEAFDKKHPGGDLKCDEIYYTGENEVFDSPKRHMIEMRFETSYLT